jgi:hypothetical protein
MIPTRKPVRGVFLAGTLVLAACGGILAGVTATGPVPVFFTAGVRDRAGLGGGATTEVALAAMGPLGVIDLPQLLQNFAPARSGFPQCGHGGPSS